MIDQLDLICVQRVTKTVHQGKTWSIKKKLTHEWRSQKVIRSPWWVAKPILWQILWNSSIKKPYRKKKRLMKRKYSLAQMTMSLYKLWYPSSTPNKTSDKKEMLLQFKRQRSARLNRAYQRMRGLQSSKTLKCQKLLRVPRNIWMLLTQR